MSQITFQKISWEQFEKDCIGLSKKLRDVPVDTIVSISRGGLVVARIVSDLLNLPISHITITSYKDFEQRKIPKITETPSTEFYNKTILLIDEVSDSGLTFEHALEYFKKANAKKVYTLAPYIKPKTKYKPDFYLTSINAWIIFPYELRETTDAFIKMFQTKEHTKEKLLQVGFEKWEIDSVLD